MTSATAGRRSIINSDPWRYVCGSCGSHSLTRRARGDHRPSVSERDSIYCQGCESHIANVYDKREGVAVPVGQNGRRHQSGGGRTAGGRR